ncbi:MAG: hypothetical protein ABI446_00555 [Gemmatimonadaceae bacterium]
MKNSWQLVWSLARGLLAATCVIASLLGCRHVRISDRRAADAGPCPHYWSLFFSNYSGDSVLSLAGRQIDVPEYNDCQRLLVNKSGGLDPQYTALKFGSVGAIFARAKLDNVYRKELPIGNAVGRPFYAALVHPNPATTRVTAIGFVWTPGNYPPLGMRGEFACIVLQWEGPVDPFKPRNYHAWMVGVGPKQTCNTPLDLPASSAFYLGAQELPTQKIGNELDSIPPVARWDWDAHRGEQYIGIACPSGWCELYGEDPFKPHGHSSSPNYQVSNALNILGQAGHVVRQKGWYDEEYLASTKSTGGTLPELDGTGAIGTVFPVPELKWRDMSNYPPGVFVPVAWISISSLSPGYSAKYGFKLNTAPPKRPDLNALFLCLDDGKGKCKVKLKKACLPTHDHQNGPQFYARLGRGPNDPDGTDFCVDFIGTNPEAPPPGTVRWRWLDDDQTIWVSCPAGCCQIKPPQ